MLSCPGKAYYLREEIVSAMTTLNSFNVPVRPVIDNVKPEISAGLYPIKRVTGEKVAVEATVFTDGHDHLAVELLHRHAGDKTWTILPMGPHPKGRNRWVAEFTVKELGRHEYTLRAWVDHFGSWREGLAKKHEAGQAVQVELLEGAGLARAAALRAKGRDRAALLKLARELNGGGRRRLQKALSSDLQGLMLSYPDRGNAAAYAHTLEIVVDPVKARFSTWYEFFPRSCSPTPGRHGTFRDAEKMIPYAAGMGFDVIYLPPIHPVGMAFRKGRNNSLLAGPQDPGSPWGIGNPSGGHKAVHPELGTLADFKHFLATAKQHRIEVALDIAYQCSPDHPYVKDHPDWFKQRPDGSIQYAENPPKKYQDIYPFNFESADWQGLCQELKSVVIFWVKQGVRLFRIDNPHTKACSFWDWMINEVKRDYPDVVFLAEAFTYPAMMFHLAKVGFAQSYTYFSWRTQKAELQKYVEELTGTDVAEYYQPNFWPNTPDILPTHLQRKDPAMYKVRYALAATLSSSCGIYGPAYELLDHKPAQRPGEEYADSEKYECRAWDLEDKGSIRPFITVINRIRHQNPALQVTRQVRFVPTDNENVLAYLKTSGDGANTVLVCAALLPRGSEDFTVKLPAEKPWNVSPRGVRMKDLMTGKRVVWKGLRHKLTIDSQTSPVVILKVGA
jgi:starch synthase (maltosyl-transferring)